ncbi:MAG: MBL fold metallo-hydrolase [Planctomycetota bacterium]
MTLDSVRCTVLIENSAGRADLAAEHGFSAWIDTGSHRVLFDTGTSGAVVQNAEALGVDLSRADVIVLSHGHYDHVGGLPAVCKETAGAVICSHPDANVDPLGHDSLTSRSPEEVVPGVHMTGQVPRVTDFETRREPPIPQPDDQAIFFRAPEGVVVVVGCAHAGVVNTLRYVARLAEVDRIHAVFGGTHLAGAPAARLEATADAFRELGIERLGPCHCTGEGPVRYFAERFPDRFFTCQTGTVLDFGGGDE